MGSEDYEREGNRCSHGGGVAEGDGESENRSGEEVGSRVEFSLRELLGIAKEFHDLLVDLVKRKRHTPRVIENTVLMNDMKAEEEIMNSHYTRPHWPIATTETPVRIGNIKEPIIALIVHG